MLPILNFFGNHTLDFEKHDYEQLKYYAISELRKLPVPEEILRMQYSSLMERFPANALSAFIDITEWSPVSFPRLSGDPSYLKKNIVSFGPMGMRIVFTPEYIILPSSIYQRIEWYSPNNKDKVQIWRSFYSSIVTHFGGDHALYVDERVVNKHYNTRQPLTAFEQTLKTTYGAPRKTLFEYRHGEYPKYYVDEFKRKIRNEKLEMKRI
jgi:hypothetical protein